jgi:hypothetical protein
MSTNNNESRATEQLARVLDFFPRVDGKATFLFALDTGMLALVGTNFHVDDLGQGYVVIPAVVAAFMLVCSLYFVYQCTFPHLKGGENSLIYFQEIAKKSADAYINSFKRQTDDDYLNDLICQIWRNSEILKIKFAAIAWAFRLTLWALVPWTIYLGAVAYLHAGSLTLS